MSRSSVGCWTLALAALIALGAVAPARAWPADWRRPWQEPSDPVEASRAPDEYAWRVFVALNWPADAVARRADPRARLGIDRPTVWEAWATANAVFRNDGADPGQWSNLTSAPTPAMRFEQISAKDAPNLRHPSGGVMVPGADPAVAWRRLTEVRFNRAAFDYIRRHQLYSLDGQIRAYTRRETVQFPVTAKTIKARWRPIGESDRVRYHTQEVRLEDGTTQLYGLVALHIATKDLGHWFWATFEHEDNTSRSGGEPWLLPSRDAYACGQHSLSCDRAPRGIALEESVWSHYRLRGTMTRYLNGDGAPKLLASSDLEAGMQASSSCMTCHARASIGVVGGAAVRLPVFDSTADPAERRGYVGLPRPEWYTGGSSHFVPLDFVWSLALAHRGGP